MLKNCQVLILFSLLPLNVVINEIAWIGTETSANDEWIELYNNTSSPINLEGWTLKTTDGTPKIQLAGSILANGFYLLERTDDNTVLNVSADQVYTGALSNRGETLELYDSSNNLIDSVDCLSGWPAGDNKTKQTMERKDDRGWQTSQNSGGTPKTKNSILIQKTKNNSTKTAIIPKSSEENSGWQSLAATGEPASQASSATFVVVLAAACLAVFSGIIILALKRKIK